MELAGCVVDAFSGNPALLMLGMVCTVVASSVWLGFATKIGFPVRYDSAPDQRPVLTRPR
jgi:phosphate/sulfate permease